MGGGMLHLATFALLLVIVTSVPVVKDEEAVQHFHGDKILNDLELLSGTEDEKTTKNKNIISNQEEGEDKLDKIEKELDREVYNDNDDFEVASKTEKMNDNLQNKDDQQNTIENELKDIDLPNNGFNKIELNNELEDDIPEESDEAEESIPEENDVEELEDHILEENDVEEPEDDVLEENNVEYPENDNSEESDVVKPEDNNSDERDVERPEDDNLEESVVKELEEYIPERSNNQGMEKILEDSKNGEVENPNVKLADNKNKSNEFVKQEIDQDKVDMQSNDDNDIEKRSPLWSRGGSRRSSRRGGWGGRRSSRRSFSRSIRRSFRRVRRSFRPVTRSFRRIIRSIRRYRKPIRRVIRRTVRRIRRPIRRYVRRIRRVIRRPVRRRPVRVPTRRSSFWSRRETTMRQKKSWWKNKLRTTTRKTKSWWNKSKAKINRGLNKIQTGLDIAGLIPGAGIIPDGINTVIHIARGNKEGTITSLGAMIPVLGQGATAGKYTLKAYRTINIDKVMKHSKITKVYPRNGKIIQEGNAKINLKEAMAAFRNSIDPSKGVKKGKGIRVGITPDGRTITIRTKGRHGPTLEIKETPKLTNKRRITGG